VEIPSSLRTSLRSKPRSPGERSVHGVTLDTGALIALERGDKRLRALVASAIANGSSLTAPAVVVAEWWRGRTDVREAILDALIIEPVSTPIAKIAGEAMARVRGATLVDAIVMASAASRGDVVMTSDLDDLERLRRHFRAVPRLLRA